MWVVLVGVGFWVNDGYSRLFSLVFCDCGCWVWGDWLGGGVGLVGGRRGNGGSGCCMAGGLLGAGGEGLRVLYTWGGMLGSLYTWRGLMGLGYTWGGMSGLGYTWGGMSGVVVYPEGFTGGLRIPGEVCLGWGIPGGVYWGWVYLGRFNGVGYTRGGMLGGPAKASAAKGPPGDHVEGARGDPPGTPPRPHGHALAAPSRGRQTKILYPGTKPLPHVKPNKTPLKLAHRSPPSGEKRRRSPRASNHREPRKT